MTGGTDLIRRGDAIKAVTDADRDCRGAHGARENIAALRSAPPVGARVWQPIETAPKDGVTEVLMYDPDLGMAVWPSSSSPWPNVTHWMPLPEPPAALLPAGEGE